MSVSEFIRSPDSTGRAQDASRFVFGDFIKDGLSIHWHDFHVRADSAPPPEPARARLEICLNFSGAAGFSGSGGTAELSAGQLALYLASEGNPQCLRSANSLHRFIVLQISAEFLRARCGAQLDLLKLPLRAFAGGECPAFLEVLPMITPLLGLRSSLLEPPVSSLAQAPWYLAKVMEILAHTAYCVPESDDLFCQRHRRQNADRVERARYLLERDLENPPSLEMLAKEVGCSPFHLSRIFAEQSGMGIPKFLRTRRIERAAELLRSRKMNVTEAAMAVGYSSLSAFNKAFVEQMGCCPGLYPVVRIPGRKPSSG